MSSITASIAELPVRNSSGRASTGTRVVMLLAVIVPFLGLVFAVVTLWGWGCSWVQLGLLLGMYAVTTLGITVGFHRLFTHRAFEANRVVQAILGVFGSMAVQGPLLKWVAMHRLHHQHRDADGDPIHRINTAKGSSECYAASRTHTSAGCSRPSRRTCPTMSRTFAKAACCAA